MELKRYLKLLMSEILSLVFVITLATIPSGFLFAQTLTDVSHDNTLPEGLVSYWTLDEASGTRIDVKGNNDLRDNNTVSSTTGLQGIAADFEGSNMETFSVSDAAQNGLDITGDLSFSMWIKPESFSTDDGQILLA